MSDEGFREIQLNGKQLIFLFMAVTVVSVVIFLFGVLVGRGVRQGADVVDVASTEIAPDPAAAAPVEASPPPAGAGSPSPAAAPQEQLSYADRLLRDTPPEETLKPPAAAKVEPSPAPVVQEPVAQKPATPPPPPASTPAATPPATAAPTAGGSTAKPAPTTAEPAPAPPSGLDVQPSDPSGPGFAIQVAAYKDRRDADILAKRLAAKGYPAFVMDPVKGTSTALFRVRVGKYKTRKDAEAVEARLQSSEQLTNAWIAR